MKCMLAFRTMDFLIALSTFHAHQCMTFWTMEILVLLAPLKAELALLKLCAKAKHGGHQFQVFLPPFFEVLGEHAEQDHTEKHCIEQHEQSAAGECTENLQDQAEYEHGQ